MNTSSMTGAVASTVSPKPSSTRTDSIEQKVQTPQTAAGEALIPPPRDKTSQEQVRLMLFGSPHAVRTSIQQLYKLTYAEPNDWSRPIATGRAHEVMAILTKRVGVG